MNEFEGVPCGVCVLRAVRSGVDYSDTIPVAPVGQKFTTGEIHQAVTLLAGSLVCWYHVDDAGKSQGM